MKINLTREQIGVLYLIVSESERKLEYSNKVHNELVDLKILFDSIAKKLQ